MMDTAKPYKGMGMEGMVAKWYAANTRKGMEEFKELARQVAEQLPEGSSVLEVAPGPGYFAIELAKLHRGQIAGLDISRTFVEIARRNASEAGVTVDFRNGDVAAMPFMANTFDFLLCRAAFKNFSDPMSALREMRRVLKPGGKALIIDLRRDAPWKTISEQVDAMGLNLFSRWMTKFTFRFMLLKRAYTRGEFERFFEQAGFRIPSIRQRLMGLEMSLEK